MEKKNANYIRKSFLDFFASKGHKIVPSAPLVVANDPTLFFVNAGMNPFKDYFLGNQVAPHLRIVNTQKCLRVSGKHNDLEEVGNDHYHHTMFEMLGNWSFGDYFKEEAIQWSWEFLTHICQLPKERLYVTIFEGDEKDKLQEDEQAYRIWKKYIAEEQIIRGNKKDNFWEMGDTGPCGPCSEIHMDLRTQEEISQVPGKNIVNHDHPDVIEIWNNVFIQFERKKDGSLSPLKQQFVDTGMGLERLVRAINRYKSNYESDLFMHSIKTVESITNKRYKASDGQVDVAFRVIADHIRAITFSIADGQIPSNVGAGYVIRRILRRAIRYYYSFLNYKQPLLTQLVDGLTHQMSDTFPELKQQDYIKKIILQEEQAFLQTLAKGLKRIEHIMEGQDKQTPIKGSDIFELYDTFGFPFDLSKMIAQEHGYTLDTKGFESALQQQQQRSRADAQKEIEDWIVVDEQKSQFIGYSKIKTITKILRYRSITQKGKKMYQIVCEQSPFYGESGGQAGDTGILQTQDGKIKIPIIDTQKENDTILLISDTTTDISHLNNQAIIAEVDAPKRNNTAHHHSATHLLQASLIQILGNHIQQKGCALNDQKIRFDFAHNKALSPQEINDIEELVNQKIRENIPVEIAQLNKEEALAKGATALFNEKYGDVVRVVTIDETFSIELCGGTHVKHTGDIGCFKIIGQSAVASGIRRVEAVAGASALKWIKEQLYELENAKREVKGNVSIADFISQQKTLLKQTIKQKELLESKLIQYQVDTIINNKTAHFYCLIINDIKQAAYLKKLSQTLAMKALNTPCILLATIEQQIHIELRYQPQDKTLSFSLEAFFENTISNIPHISGGGKGNQFSATIPIDKHNIQSLQQHITKALDNI